VKYRKYINPMPEGPERLDVMPYPSQRAKLFRVTGKRRVSPGRITSLVTADSLDEAKALFEGGAVPAIGLGWVVVQIEEVVS
jgi:hypothetical protein